MGLLKRLFGTKDEKATEVVTKDIAIPQRTLLAHPDLQDLLWIADGPKKNYVPQSNDQSFEYDGIRITFSSFSAQEPSLMSTKLSIQDAVNPLNVERPPYYPSYTELTAEQRGVYWKLLADPYSGKFDIGYVFILYYGLERHLLEGNYEKAFHVILKLRDIYENNSFQGYSACALVLTCLFRQRPDFAAEFYHSLDKNYELCFSDNLYMLCKMGLDIPLTAKDLMRIAKTFEFSNQNYIKKYPEIFETKLLEEMQIKYSTNKLDIKDFVSQAELRKLRKQTIPVFSNVSLREQSIDVPLISESFKLKKAAYDLLELAHTDVKTEVAQMRKAGTFPVEEESKTVKIIKQLTFDSTMEAQLQGQYKKARSNAMDKHFALIVLQDFYYKYSEIDKKYLETCISYCEEDISLLPQVQFQYERDEKASIQRLANVYSKKEIAKKLAAIGCFSGNIPAFKRLAIIYEKSKDFESTKGICDQAVAYYDGIGLNSAASEFAERKNKVSKRIQK